MMSLQLADHSIKCPGSILEDVPIKVSKFFIPTDFVVLKIEEDSQIPIILGWPFLATASANIDVKNNKLSLTIRDEKAEFDLSNAISHLLLRILVAGLICLTSYRKKKVMDVI